MISHGSVSQGGGEAILPAIALLSWAIRYSAVPADQSWTDAVDVLPRLRRSQN
jgi:hypothetical protein